MKFVIYLKNRSMLFLKGRKTAGTSLEIALSKYAEAEDIITPIIMKLDEETREKLGYPGPQNYQASVAEILLRHPMRNLRAFRNDNLRTKYWHHMPSAAVRNALGQEVWESCERLTIMRNPFEKIVSWFFWNQREFLKNKYSEKEIVTEFFPSWVDTKVSIFLDDRKIYLLDGLPAMTRYLKFETISDELKSLELESDFPGLQETFSSVKAKSGQRPKWATRDRFFSENHEVRKKIETIYDWEINEFGYSL